MLRIKLFLPPLVLLSLLWIPVAHAEPVVRLAQMGSTGGALGDDDKSVSGGQSAPVEKKIAKPRSVEKKPLPTHLAPPTPPKPVHAVVKAPVEERPAPEVQERQPKPRAVSMTAYNGVYSGASTGPCIPRWSWSFQVVNGIMTGESGSNISGAVKPNGVAVGEMVVFGSTYNFSGQLTSAGASGTWIRHGAGGCSGTWSATR